jgi:predicted acylesterase/phospholipase RssA
MELAKEVIQAIGVPPHEKVTALILPGAGARGRLQAGALKAAKESRVKYHMIFGTSSGALNGSIFHQGDVDLLIELWMNIKNSDVYCPRPWHLLGRDKFIFTTEPLKKLIAKLVTPRKSNIPFFVSATNSENMRSETFLYNVFPVDGARELLRASAALPLLFPSVQIWNKEFVDGGIGRNMPLTQAFRAGARRFIVLQPTPPSSRGKQDSLIAELARIIGEFEVGVYEAEIDAIKDMQRLDPSIELVEMRPSNNPPNGLLQFGLNPVLAKSVIDEGYELTRDVLKAAGLWTPGV